MDIIVAEDHPVSAKLLEKILLRAGHNVYLAEDGEAAWDMLCKHQARMMLTDWMMPRLDGLSLCRRIRETPPSSSYVYLVLLTARDGTADILSGFEAGADDYIAKPVNPDELMARIRVGLRHLSMEDRHEKTLRRLMRSEKMASLGQLAAGMAHEINNPLSFLASNLTTLEQYSQKIYGFFQSHRSLTPSLPAENEFKDKIKSLEKQYDIAYILEDMEPLITESGEGIQRIHQIIEDLRIFTHPGSMQPEPVDIHQCITISLSMLAQKTGASIPVEKNLAELPPFSGFSNQLQQAFLNIALNGVQAMDYQGSLFIQTEASDSHILIRFQDTGTGIDPEILPKIFDPFFTTKPVGQGTGLGLHVAHTLVQSHGGHISVATASGKGSTFTIHLPLKEH
ncbi:response regulator [Desulfobotulus sp. H1]|uniref:histidine kinase n=1 Tax=Desulfobotulus pelophilus TaxID=2823377 RepID=A0ABT3N715_9BACT|nr:ATP-binding protein [Desulfobotulus pelophilus]MCW7753245.1 response regulator [Desulfobotulus pelophilus]